MSKSLFPKNFLWGASTAAHQVEGGTVNQWSEWELAHAKELAKTSARRLRGIPTSKAVKSQAGDPQNYVSGRGVEHYKLYETDFDLVEELNLNSFRFSIEWSRIEPKEGAWNVEAIEHYRAYLRGLKARGIEPVVTLWHWTVPNWFDAKGGFEKQANLYHFDRFVQKIADEYAKDLSYVVTLNEPNVYAVQSYATGEWPPQQHSYFMCTKVYWNLVQVHRRAYKILKSKNPRLHVGVAASLENATAKRPYSLVDNVAVKISAYAWNWWFLNRIKKQQDFVGLNYYFTTYYRGLFNKLNPRWPLSDLGWYMQPDGIYPLLTELTRRYKKPIIITENGLADANDVYRKWWLEQTVVAMQRALSEGVDLKGYLHWSLLDNFEWAYGWWPKFGLVAVDRANGMKRTVRPSAKWYANYVASLKQGKEPND